MDVIPNGVDTERFLPVSVAERMKTRHPIGMGEDEGGGFPVEFGQPGRHYLLADFSPEGNACATELLLTDQNVGSGLGWEARSWTQQQLAVERSLDLYAEL